MRRDSSILWPYHFWSYVCPNGLRRLNRASLFVEFGRNIRPRSKDHLTGCLPLKSRKQQACEPNLVFDAKLLKLIFPKLKVVALLRSPIDSYQTADDPRVELPTSVQGWEEYCSPSFPSKTREDKRCVACSPR